MRIFSLKLDFSYEIGGILLFLPLNFCNHPNCMRLKKFNRIVALVCCPGN